MQLLVQVHLSLSVNVAVFTLYCQIFCFVFANAYNLVFFLYSLFKGLLKARKVLSADYGTVHLHFGDVVSLRDFCQGSINRAEYALFPRYAC